MNKIVASNLTREERDYLIKESARLGGVDGMLLTEALMNLKPEDLMQLYEEEVLNQKIEALIEKGTIQINPPPFEKKRRYFKVY